MVNFYNKLKKLITKYVKNKRTSTLYAFLAGCIGSIPYYFENLFLFTFVSLFCIFYIVTTQRRVHKRIFVPFFMYFLGFYTPLYSFLSELYPYERFGFSTSQAGFIVVCSCILIPLLHSVVIAGVMYISKWIEDGWKLIIAYPALWVISEWVLTLGNMAFPWGNIAVSLTGFLPYLQTASLLGKDFITFITVAACAGFVYSIKNKHRTYALIGCIIFIVNSLLGVVLMHSNANTNNVVKTAVIQGNVLSNEKWVAGNSEKILETYVSMAEEAAKNGAKLIVLPESAIPFSFSENGIIHKRLSTISEIYNVTVITGINYRDQDSLYNSVIGIYPNGKLSSRYDKRHLVPFGEFIPLVDLLGNLVPFVGEFYADTGKYSQGTHPVIINTEYGNVAPLVCFDSIFEKYAREGAYNGGDTICVVTNDSWFNDSQGIYTHLRHSQIRAIENGRFITRAANTGISAFINNKGQIKANTNALEQQILYCDVAFISDKTLYTHIGDVVLYISYAIILVMIVLYKRSAKNGKNSAS